MLLQDDELYEERPIHIVTLAAQTDDEEEREGEERMTLAEDSENESVLEITIEYEEGDVVIIEDSLDGSGHLVNNWDDNHVDHWDDVMSDESADVSYIGCRAKGPRTEGPWT